MESYQVKRIVLYVVILVLGKASSQPNIIEGVCNWNASSGPKVIPPSVFTVHFTACRTGRLVWNDPYGGVEVEFESEVPMATLGTYQVCLSAKDFGTNIFAREGNKFNVLRRHDNENTTSDICVESKTKKILIYFESSENLKTKSALFRYRTFFIRKGSGILRPKDCKACGYDELVKSFCAGDFAVHGYVKTVLPIGGGRDRGEAVVVAKKVLHQSFKIFQETANTREVVGNVNFPLYCHWKKRTKHGFLFTGSIEDGAGPVVQCRIKFKRWKRVYHKDICNSLVMQT